MNPVAEKVAELLTGIPYDKIREDAFDALTAGKVLNGDAKDIGAICSEVAFRFKKEYAEKLARDVIHLVVRQANKVLCEGVKDWYTAKMFQEEALKSLGDFDLGEAATA